MERVWEYIACQIFITIFLFGSMSVYSEFIPPSDQVCLGDSITFNCVLTGSFPAVQGFYIDSTAVSFMQINNLDNYEGVDLTRLSATVDNTHNESTFAYTVLHANVTLVDITKEDNGTLIGCSALESAGPVEESDTLILADPPSQPDILLTSIPSNCSVRVHWSYPVLSSLPLTEQITDSATNNMVTIQDQSYLSNSLTAGEDITFTLSASNCLGDSVTSDSDVFSPPSQPEAYSCVADYGTENTLLVLRILNYTSDYAIQTRYAITDDTDSAMIDGDFSTQDPLYFSTNTLEFNSSINYTVLLTSLLRDCLGSMSTSCQVELNITNIVTTTPPTMSTTTGSASSSIPTASSPNKLPTYVIYLLIAFILFIILLLLASIIIALVLLLVKGKFCKHRRVPKDARPIPKQSSTPETSDHSKEEMHYIKPQFSSNPVKPAPPVPKTYYSEIREMPAATEALSSL